MSDENDDDATHSDSSAVSSAASDSKQLMSSDGRRLDVEHMYSDQSQDGQMRSRTTVIRDIVKVTNSQSRLHRRRHHHHHHHVSVSLNHIVTYRS